MGIHPTRSIYEEWSDRKKLDELAKGGDKAAYALPIPNIPGYDFSFSGLKTAVINLAHHAKQVGEELDAPSLAASFCGTVASILSQKFYAAAKETGDEILAVAGGVSANSFLRSALLRGAKRRGKYLYLPESQNDFIFAVICEEFGFVGAVTLIVLFGLLLWRGIVIATKAPDTYSSILTMGIISQIAMQCIMNIAVVTGSMPVTGVSLPFFSYGGSSLIMLLVEMGMILSVSRYSYQQDK